MNKIKFNKYIETNYNDLISRINKKVNNINLTKEIFSRVYCDLIDSIEEEKYNSLVEDDSQIQKYVIKLCLNNYNWGNSDFYRLERLRELYREDIEVQDVEDIIYEESEESIKKHKKIIKYYTQLPLPKQILFELLFIEGKTAGEIFNLLNNNCKLSKGHIYHLVKTFREETLENLK